ncbi:RloB family protein [Brachybacterium epidermidis]|uniref:RloB family protein n=1 Tax=Brachybacterium epidermidis TaxID=2781983 RepID=UPI00398F5945
MPERRRGRSGRPTRQAKRTILLVTNGEVTEKRYLEELKQRAPARELGIAITVKIVPGEPPSVLRKLASPKGDTSAFDEVWFVFDEDGHDRSDIFAECERRSSRRQEWHAIVSRPCFEVWLIAHYDQVRSYPDQAKAQAHYRRLVGRGAPAKQLPQAFPYEAAEAAVGRSHLPGADVGPADSMPPSPGSGMPHLLRRLGLAEGVRPSA